MKHACEVAFPSNLGTRRGTISAKERCYVFFPFLSFLSFSPFFGETEGEREREGKRGREVTKELETGSRASVSDAVDRDDDNASLRGPRFFIADARLLCVSPGHAQRFLAPAFVPAVTV